MTAPPLPLEQLSFTGQRDSLDPTTAEPRKAFLLENVYPQDAQLGGAAVGRPGFVPLGAAGAGQQLGAVGQRRGLRSYQFTQLDGTERTVVFVGGRMYTYDWALDTFTEVTLVGVGLTATATVYAATFNDKLIVNPNDGVNKPWSWDGASFVSLVNAPLLFARLAIYYAKLFGIKWADRGVVVWSEENDETTGYETGFNNTWRLAQTDQEPLFAVIGTNEALYYFRARSTGAILGAVTPEFQTTGTREAVSSTVGTISPNAVVEHEGHIYFISADVRPYRLVPGGGIQPLWRDMRETIRAIPRTKIAEAAAADWTPAGLILFGVPEVNQAENTHVLTLAYDDEGGTLPQFAGVWRGFTFTALDMVKSDNGFPTLWHLSVDGFAYKHGNPRGVIWDDTLAGPVAAPIAHAVTGTPLGFDTRLEKAFERIDLSLRAASDMDLAVDLETPRGIGPQQAVSVTGGFSVWDEAKWDTDLWATAAEERHVSVGLDDLGRWARPRIRHEVLGQQFGLVGWKLLAFPDAPEPEVP